MSAIQHQIKVYGRGKRPFIHHRALTDYCIVAPTVEEAGERALKLYRKGYTGMVPQVVEVGGVRQIPGAGQVLWVAKGVPDPRKNFI